MASVPESSYKNAIARIHNKNNKIIGAGFLVAGGVITCAHVVRDALGLKGKDVSAPIGATVKVSFPFSASKQTLVAEVLIYQYCKDEDAPKQDVAALRLRESPPEKAIPIRALGTHGLNNPFRIIGFPSGRRDGRESIGRFMTQLSDDFVQIVGQQGYPIQAGFSGAAVWDETVKAVVGITVAIDKEDLDETVAFMIPATSLIEVQRRLSNLALQEMLTTLDENVQTELAMAVHTAYELCCPEGWTQPIPDSLEDKLHSLQDMMPGDNRYEAIDRFAALLTLPNLALDQTLREQIQQWVESKVENFQDLVAQVKAQLEQWLQCQETATESLLLIYVTPVSGTDYPVSALFMPDVSQYRPKSGLGCQPVQAPKQEPFAEKVSEKTLHKLIQACLEEVNQKGSSNLMIQLILPLALLHQSCDHCSLVDRAKYPFMPEMRVGIHYRLVVRIAERIEPYIFNTFRGEWEKKWKALLKLTAGKVPGAFTLGDGLVPGQALLAKLKEQKSMGLKLSRKCKDEQYFKIFGDLIAAGTPAAIWLRSDQFANGLIVTDEIDTLLKCQIATLPEAIKQARSNAIEAAEDAHIGHHLSFLWDDPNLLPPKAHPSNQTSLGMS